MNTKKIEFKTDNISGIEFDWFAIDNMGHYALMSSAGSGIVPMSVIEDYKSHTSITKQFDLPDYGSEQIWGNFAEYGLYVFDYDIHKNSYIRKSKPLKKIPEYIKNELKKLRNIPRLNCSFETNSKIDIKI
jgi:hypothetical protein